MKKLAYLAAVIFLGLCVPQAHAAISILYDIGGGPVVLATSPTDSDTINFNGTVGTFNISFLIAGSTSPGTPTLAQVTSDNFFIQNTAASTKSITFFISAQDFTAPVTPPVLLLSSNIGGSVQTGSASNLLSFSSCVDSTNAATACPGTSQTPVGSPDVTGSPTSSYNNTQTLTISSLVPTGPPADTTYSLGQELVIQLGANGKLGFNSTTSLTTVPEPTSIVLLGGVILVCGRLIRRKIKV
jgi:hypothetical protein